MVLTEDEYREAWVASIPREFAAARAPASRPTPQPSYGTKVNCTLPTADADAFKALAAAQGYASYGRFLSRLVIDALEDPHSFPVPSGAPEPRGGLTTLNAVIPADRHPDLLAVAVVAGVSVAACVRAVVRDALNARVSG